jgi:uncharacterized membrane protein
MKRVLFSMAVLFLFPFLASAEEIRSFTSDIELSTDGFFVVTENIEYDFKNEDRHGIFRSIEKKHPQEATSNWKERYIDIELQDVFLDGAPVAYEVTDTNSQLEVKIGDPYSTVSGVHRYTAVYTVNGGYSYFEDGSAEIYWNATGQKWQVPMHAVAVTLHGTPTLFSEHSACYKGAYGANTACEITRKNDESTTFTATNLGSSEGITIAQELNGAQLEIVILEKWKWVLFGLLMLPLLLVGVAYAGYRYKTAHKTGMPIIAQYEPYEHFKPMYSGMLLDGRLDPHDITAGIVYLAEQGYLKIRRIERKVLFLFEVDDYEITLLRSVADIESDFLRDVALLLFDLHDVEGKIVSLDDLRQRQTKRIENAKRLQKLRSDLKSDMKKEGFYQVNTLFVQMVITAIVFAALIFFLGAFLVPEVTTLLLGMAVVGVLFLVLLYERRTRRGYEALDHLKGFKLFLSVTDAERFTFHNAPQKSPEQFMHYLPYAIAFGVEKEWAEVFKDITIPNPDWYDGGSVSSFSAVNLINSLGAFSTSMVASSVSSAGSSGGSSGGGFSGGGGGGGGGGSW